MDAVDSETLREEPPEGGASQEAARLNQLFGGYRAEWLKEHLYEVFTEPLYFPELKGVRPCILEGGRGTGKTTVLRCLSYEGQFALAQNVVARIREWDFFGLYSRVNTNRVTAFDGPELSEREWTRLYAHYVNLEFVEEVARFLVWYAERLPSADCLPERACRAVAAALHVTRATDIAELLTVVTEARNAFEAYINNVGDDGPKPLLSMQGAPLDALMREVATLEHFRGRHFFFLIDEYENLLDYQQRVINTLIKHSGDTYTFKVGVKELGLRVRSTLNENEHLISPADYVRIHISDKLGDRFPEFAARVCQERLRRIHAHDGSTLPAVEVMFGSLSEEREAELLGVRKRNLDARESLSKELPVELLSAFDQAPPLMAYLLNYWAEAKGTTLEEQLHSYVADRGEWEQRLENYQHALLFTIRQKKRGIRKYYAGWDVVTRLAGGNIRYLLELVDQCLLAKLRDGGALGEPLSYELQTEVAQAVGKKNLTELEGVSVHGVRLTRLLLGLGRVFQVLAANPEGHTPEANQFTLRDPNAEPSESDVGVEALLRSAVMHLALIRFPGNKLQDDAETKAYDYMVHPVFAAFFEFSYRRKRKIVISGDQLIGLVEHPRQAISTVLKAQNRSVEEPLPEQLRLFEGFYAGGF